MKRNEGWINADNRLIQKEEKEGNGQTGEKRKKMMMMIMLKEFKVKRM